MQGGNEEISNAGRESPQERQQLPLGEPGMACGSESLCDPGDQCLCTPLGTVGSMPSPGRPGTMGSNSRSLGDVGVGEGCGVRRGASGSGKRLLDRPFLDYGPPLHIPPACLDLLRK